MPRSFRWGLTDPILGPATGPVDPFVQLPKEIRHRRMSGGTNRGLFQTINLGINKFSARLRGIPDGIIARLGLPA